MAGVPENLADFLRYLKGEAQKGELVQLIEREVIKARTHEGWGTGCPGDIRLAQTEMEWRWRNT